MTDLDGKLNHLALASVSTLQEFLSSGEVDAKRLAQARVAATVLSAWTRHKQTEGAREATTFMMARELARDKEELAAYIRATLPQAAIVKALPAPSTDVITQNRT